MSSLIEENDESFYFQQRRGNLNIRMLAKLDLESIIRNIDIDTLQDLLENITFCSLKQSDLQYLSDPLILKLFHLVQLMLEYLLYTQNELIKQLTNYSKKYSNKKRELMKKRKELVSLQESTNQLKNEIKQKKENINTLESLLKDASKKRSKQRYLEKLDIDEDSNSEVLKDKTNKQKRDNRYKSKKSKNDSDADDELDDIPIVKDKSESIVPNKENEIDLKSILDKHQVALSEIANEMKRGLELSVQSLQQQYEHNIKVLLDQSKIKEQTKPIEPPVSNKPSTTDIDLFVYMTEKWNKLETSVRNQMEEQLLTYETRYKANKLPSKGSLTVGELENDTIDPINKNASKQIINQLQSFDSSLSTLRVDVKDATVAIADTQLLILQRGKEIAQLKEELRQSQENILTTVKTSSNNMSASSNEVKSAPSIVEKPLVKPSLSPKPTYNINTALSTINKANEKTDPYIEKVVPMSPKILPVPSNENLNNKIEIVQDVIPSNNVELRNNDNLNIEPVVSNNNIESYNSNIESKPNDLEESIMDIPLMNEQPDIIPVIPNDNKLDAIQIEPNDQLKDDKRIKINEDNKPVEEIKVDETSLVFTQYLNPDIIFYDKEEIVISNKIIPIDKTKPKDLLLDELIFNIRRAVAEEISVPLARVSLVYNGKIVTLGMDIESDPFDFNQAVNLAKTGQLKLKITLGKVVTDAQLDQLVQSWEKKNMTLLQSRESDLSISGKKWSNMLRSVGSSNEMYADDSDFDDEITNKVTNDETVMKPTDIVKKSLEFEYDSVSEKEGLTDDELIQKLNALNDITKKLPSNKYDQLRESRNSGDELITKILSENESDDNKSKPINVYLSQKFKTGLLKLSPTSGSSIENNMKGSNPLTSDSPKTQPIFIRKRRNFDEDDDTPLMASQSKQTYSVDKSALQTKGFYDSYDSKDYLRKQSNDMKMMASIDSDILKNNNAKDESPSIKIPSLKSNASNRYSNEDIVMADNKNNTKSKIDSKVINTYDTNDMSGLESTYSDIPDSLNITSDTGLGDTSEWNRTVDSNITNLPNKEKYLRTSVIQRKADEYEENAQINNSDQMYTSSLSTDKGPNNSKNSNNSPFRALHEESFDSQNHSLALSDSAVDDFSVVHSSGLRK